MSESSWSAPESDVLAAIRELREANRDGVLATVVDVEGSAYRRPGAKMVVPRDGDGVGSITAGCLEDEVLRLAADVLEEGEPRIEVFDLMGDDDVWGLGVGCNGVIDLLLEPIGEGLADALARHDAGEPLARVAVLSADDPDVPRWTRAHLEDGFSPDDVADLPAWLASDLVPHVEAAIDRGNGHTVTVEGPNGAVEVFVDGLVPPPDLLVVGTGHDVDPIVELASKNGFSVTVVGFRGAEATADRFPLAEDVVSTSPRDLREHVSVDEDTYAVIATHNFVDDQLALAELLDTDVEYVGLMGPTDRFEELVEAIEADERALTDAELETVYTPIGLDLGGSSPYQIATSIVAEVLAVHNGRDPVHLSERSGPIHDRSTVDAA